MSLQEIKGVSCSHHSKSRSLPLNPMECGFCHIPSDLVVDHWTSAVEGSSHLDFLSLHAMWTTFGGLISYKIMSIISVGCDFTTKSGGIWAGSFHDDPPVLGGIVYQKS